MKDPKHNVLDDIRTPGKLLPQRILNELAAVTARAVHEDRVGDIRSIAIKIKGAVVTVVGSAEPDRADACQIAGPEQPCLVLSEDQNTQFELLTDRFRDEMNSNCRPLEEEEIANLAKKHAPDLEPEHVHMAYLKAGGKREVGSTEPEVNVPLMERKLVDALVKKFGGQLDSITHDELDKVADEVWPNSNTEQRADAYKKAIKVRRK